MPSTSGDKNTHDCDLANSRIVAAENKGEQNIGTATPSWLVWLGLAVIGVFLYLVRSILPPFVVGAFIAYILSPLVGRLMERWGLSRPLAILVLYLTLLGPFAVIAALVGPRFVQETRELIVHGPDIVTSLVESVFGPGPYDVFGTTVNARQMTFGLFGSLRSTIGTPGEAIRLLASFSELILALFLTIVVSIYFLADGVRVERALLSFVPASRRPGVYEVSDEIHRTLARYFRRLMVLVALVATATFFGLEFIFHLRYALPIAVATGFLEIVPFLGPVVAASIAALVAISQGGVTLAIWVIVFYTVIRQLEDQIVSPVVLGNAVELHPLIVIFAVLAGGTLFGVLGTLAAIPVAASIKVIVDYAPKLIAGPGVPAKPLPLATVGESPQRSEDANRVDV